MIWKRTYWLANPPDANCSLYERKRHPDYLPGSDFRTSIDMVAPQHPAVKNCSLAAPHCHNEHCVADPSTAVDLRRIYPAVEPVVV